MSVDTAPRNADASPSKADTGPSKSDARRRVLKQVGRYALLTFLAFVVLFPIYITVVNSLLTPQQIGKQPADVLPDPSAVRARYSDAWSAGHLGTYLKNSFIVTIIITVGQVVTAILAGYAFAFLEFPFKRTLFVVFLATLMVPFEVTIVTNLTTISDLGLVRQLRRARGAVPRDRVRRVPDPPDVPDPPARPARRRRARRLRALAVPDPGRGAARAPGDRGARGVRVPRRPGTSTCGHCSSPRTIGCGPSRSVSASCRGSPSTSSNVTFAGAVIAVVPLVDPPPRSSRSTSSAA